MESLIIKGDTEFKFEVSPNPNNGNNIQMHITSGTNQRVYVQVYGALGQFLLQQQYMISEIGKNTFSLHFNTPLSAGVYIFKAIPDIGIPVSLRVVVQ